MRDFSIPLAGLKCIYMYQGKWRRTWCRLRGGALEITGLGVGWLGGRGGGGVMKIFRARIFSFMSPMSAGFFSLGLSFARIFFFQICLLLQLIERLPWHFKSVTYSFIHFEDIFGSKDLMTNKCSFHVQCKKFSFKKFNQTYKIA